MLGKAVAAAPQCDEKWDMTKMGFSGAKVALI
jgi:hypothetical protein